MAKHSMGKHSDLIRGLKAAGKNEIKPGQPSRFGRMFPDLPGATFGKTARQQKKNLEKLAALMISPFDKPKDGPDSEESGTPSDLSETCAAIAHGCTTDHTTHRRWN
jgi:hypothetical protein